MTGKASRAKGNKFELDIANLLQHHGWDGARRCLEKRFDIGDIDQGPAGVHIECKNHATFDLAGWTGQVAESLASPNNLADIGLIIVKRRGHAIEGSYAVSSLPHQLRLLKEAGR